MTGSASTTFIRAWRVGQFTATLRASRVQPGETPAAVIEREPSVPQRLSKSAIVECREGRDSALRDLAVEFGPRTASQGLQC